jgi:hypothetical protein
MSDYPPPRGYRPVVLPSGLYDRAVAERIDMRWYIKQQSIPKLPTLDLAEIDAKLKAQGLGYVGEFDGRVRFRGR